MKITKNILFLGILIYGLIINILVYFDLQYFFIRSILTASFFTFIPGLLLMLIIRIKKLEFWEYLVYIISLSISFLMLVGIVVNLTFPLIQIKNPLAAIPLLLSYDLVLIVLWNIAYKRNREIIFELKFPRLDFLNKVFFIVPISFPILSYLGATTLNNYGENYLSTFLISVIVVFAIFLVLFRKQLNKNIYPWTIFIISIALLFMYSQRGLHVSGWDIQSEYSVFAQTRNSLFWDLNQAKQSYYSMLSITILPTIISTLAKVSGEFVFKTVIQILFSLVPLTIYLLFKKFSNKIISFVATFYFISQGQFLAQMPTLIRQEVAFIFFGSALLILFNKRISYVKRNVLFLVFGCSLIVSHYSTAYVAIAVFAASFCATLILRGKLVKAATYKLGSNLKLEDRPDKNYKFNLSGYVLILIILFNYFWTFQITHSSDNFTKVINDTYNNLSATSGKMFRNVEASKAIWDIGVNLDYTINDLRDYMKETTEYYALKQQNINPYDKDITSQYQIKTISLDNVPSENLKSNAIFYIIIELAKKTIKIFLLVGLLYFIIIIFKSDYSIFSTEYPIMSMMFIILSILLILIPNISTDYNFIRLYQQALMVLALPTIIGGVVLIKKIFKVNSIFPVLLIIIVIFMNSSGSITQISGGSNPALQLNNFGTRYEKDFVHEGEIYGAMWLSKNIFSNNYVYADEIASMRLKTYGAFSSKNIKLDVIPQAIDKNSYVYLGYQNMSGREYRTYRSWELRFNYPNQFLNDNKNLVYNNGYSEIYK